MLAAILFMGLPAQAQIVNAIRKAIVHYTPGVVNFKDGHHEEYAFVEIPKQGLTKLKVTNDPKHKNPEELNAADIASVTLWTEDDPATTYTLYYVHADKSKLPFLKTYPVDAWGYPIASSPWGTVYKCNSFYEVDKKSGKLEARYNTRTTQMGYSYVVEEVAAGCYMVCRDYENAQIIGGSKSAWGKGMTFIGVPKRIGPIFKSNPSIEKRIKEQKLRGDDIQYILDQMAIFHGLSTETVVEDANTNANGTVGDDE